MFLFSVEKVTIRLDLKFVDGDRLTKLKWSCQCFGEIALGQVLRWYRANWGAAIEADQVTICSDIWNGSTSVTFYLKRFNCCWHFIYEDLRRKSQLVFKRFSSLSRFVIQTNRSRFQSFLDFMEFWISIKIERKLLKNTTQVNISDL